MADEHLHPNRGWALIRDKGQFTLAETEHLQACEVCHDWILSFAELARKSGFTISFEIPRLQTPRIRLDRTG